MKKDPWFRNRRIRDGIYKALHEVMSENLSVHILGEGAVMKIHFDSPMIEKDFPHRVITMPISEDANSNFAVGLSLAGIVPVVDVISSDFLYRTMDAICNTMAKAAVVGDARTMVVRAEFLTGGPTSGQRIEALFAHVPGLHVYIPSNAEDAYDLTRLALERKGVTLLFEDRMIEDAAMPDERFGSMSRSGLARISSQRGAITVASYGITLRRCEDVLSQADIIDLRALWPLDVEAVLESVRRTRKLLVVEPDVQFLGIGAELVATVAQEIPGVVVKRLGAPRATIPSCRDLHEHMIPTEEQILEAVRSML
jgi:acetoin:2,6-dichlorophenolindophenol oxidoreductase subunit beta